MKNLLLIIASIALLSSCKKDTQNVKILNFSANSYQLTKGSRTWVNWDVMYCKQVEIYTPYKVGSSTIPYHIHWTPLDTTSDFLMVAYGNNGSTDTARFTIVVTP